MLLQDLLRQSAERYPDKCALKFHGTGYTYSRIDKISNQVARLLRAKGLQRGGRVLIYLENCPELIFAVYGTLKADGIFVVINPQTKRDKLVYIINNSGAELLICHPKFFRKQEDISHFRKDCHSLKNIIFTERKFDDYSLFSEYVHHYDGKVNSLNIDIDLAGLIYTSGSTGLPKGVTMTHLNIRSAVFSIIKYLGNTPEDIILNVLPLSFDYGLYQVFMCFTFGGTLVLLKDFVFITRVLHALERESITGFPVVPSILSLIFKLADLKRYDLSHLRYISSTGDVFPVKYIKRLRQELPQVQIFSMYGLTECKRVAYLEPEEIDQRPESVGKTIPNLEVMVVDEKGNRLPAGQAGELVVRGASVMQGYWNDPEETARRIKTGRYPQERLLYTGDLFRMDEAGYLYFMGRMDDLLKIKGERVAPKEIEEAIHHFPEVNEVAAVGIPDEIWGNSLIAFVVLKSDAESIGEKKIIQFCKKKLENYAVPRRIVFKKDLPKTPNGKVDKKALLQEAGSGKKATE